MLSLLLFPEPPSSLLVITSYATPFSVHLCILSRTLSPAKENKTRAQEHT